MDEGRTTVVVQRYLNELAGVRGDAPAEPIVRSLLEVAVDRLRILCSKLLRRHYPRLTRGPLNLHSDEMLGGVVERLLKAMRQVRPQTVRQFFALANQHMRWELNDLARRFDEKGTPFELTEPVPAPVDPSDSRASPGLLRILAAIENLPEEEREAFNLVRVQGMTHGEAAGVMDCSTKTVQRRLNRGLILLEEGLRDLRPPLGPSGEASSLAP